jgi:hypothetical protein
VTIADEQASVSIDQAESLLTTWGEKVAAEYARMGYAAMGYHTPSGTSLTDDEYEHLTKHGRLPAKIPDYVWLPEDLDRAETAMQFVMVRDTNAVRVLKGVYVWGWKRGRAHSRALDLFRYEYGQVCAVREGLHNAL